MYSLISQTAQVNHIGSKQSININLKGLHYILEHNKLMEISFIAQCSRNKGTGTGKHTDSQKGKHT